MLAHSHLFYIGKKVIRKRGSNGQNLKKITRFNFQSYLFLLAKNGHYVIIMFEILKIDFKFECTRLAKKGLPILVSLSE